MTIHVTGGRNNGERDRRTSTMEIREQAKYVFLIACFSKVRYLLPETAKPCGCYCSGESAMPRGHERSGGREHRDPETPEDIIFSGVG